MSDPLKKVSKAHIIYKTKDGKRVPGATTITGLLNKPYLIIWANNLGLEGIDSTAYRDAAADIGTLAHAMIQVDLQGEELDLNEYSPFQIKQADNSLRAFFDWKKQNKIEPILCEKPLVSEIKKYGGTIDCYCKLNGIPTLLDFKTGKAIYDEYFIQLAAYKNLLEEHGKTIEQCKILRIGRSETEGFEERSIMDTSKYCEMFFHLLDVYYLKKAVGWK